MISLKFISPLTEPGPATAIVPHKFAYYHCPPLCFDRQVHGHNFVGLFAWIHIQLMPTKVSAIKFKMDLFAEDEASRTVVEIQKVDYDYTYDRFAHYFMGNLIDMQRSSKDYAFAKEVYIIVVVTSAYRISDKNGKPIKANDPITIMT